MYAWWTGGGGGTTFTFNPKAGLLVKTLMVHDDNVYFSSCKLSM